MKTKEEVIKEAWGEYYNHGVGIDNNGWLSENYLTNDQCKLLNSIDSIEHTRKAAHDLGCYDSSISIYRPKSLHGIEDNNGWIRIESEDDLPNGYVDLYLAKLAINNWDDEDYVFHLVKDFNRHVPFKLKKALEYTHYQPIIKPNKPMY